MTAIRITPDYKALRDLLGGDEQALVELRQGIAEEFARKHLKALVNEPLLQQAKTDLEHDFQRRITELVGTVTRGWNGTSVKLRPEIKEVVEARAADAAHKAIDDHVRQGVAAYLERINVESLVRSIANQRITSTVNAMVDAEIKRRLAAVANG